MVEKIVIILQIGAVGCAFRAAYVWYLASNVKTLIELNRMVNGQIAGAAGFEEVRRLVSGIVEQSCLNARAAKWTAASVLLQMLAICAPLLSSDWAEGIVVISIAPALLMSYFLPVYFIMDLLGWKQRPDTVSASGSEDDRKRKWLGLYVLFSGVIWVVSLVHSDRLLLLQSAWVVICGLAILIFGKSWWWLWR